MSSIYYSSIIILAIIIHVILNYSYYIQKDDRQEVKDYKKYLGVIFLYYLSDAAWGILQGSHHTFLLYADTIFYYITMAFSVAFCCRYIISFLGLRRTTKTVINTIGLIFGFCMIAGLVANYFLHTIFWIDQAGVHYAYSARAARNLVLIIQVLMFGSISAMSLFFALKKNQGAARYRNHTICLFSLTLTCFLVAQGLFPLLPLYSVGLMLSTLIVHVFIRYEEQQVQLRTIKKLNNRLQTEQAELQEQKNEIATAFSVINGLTPDFHTIWLADKATMKIQPIRSPRQTVNKGALDIAALKLDSDELMRLYIANYVAPLDRERLARQVNKDEVLRQLGKSDFYAVNYMRLREDGGQDYNQIVFANADTPDGKQQLVFGFRDINYILEQEKALRKEINDAKEAAEAANAAKTSFLFNMSHDIRTPMNAIIGFRDLLEKNIDDGEKRLSYLKKIEESSNVLLSIINNVLEMARIEKGTLDLNESAWSIEQFMDSLYSVFIEMMQQKGLEFTQQVNVSHHYIFCDAIKLREVFINILSNAYKYTKSGGKVHFQMDELPCEREGYARYRATVSDTGIGMSEDFLPHLFEEFSRESNTTHSKIEGTGLGMPIVKRLVDFMGGTLEVSSQKGVGSTFTVTLEHRIADKSELAQVADERPASDFQGKRILLAEDNELNAEIAIAVLTEIGFEVERAEDGQACIDKLVQAEAGRYDLILMDIQMPRLNGYEATRAIRQLPDPAKANIKILAMTANAFEEDKREAMRAGMDGHLAKPINLHELTKAIAGLLKS